MKHVFENVMTGLGAMGAIGAVAVGAYKIGWEGAMLAVGAAAAVAAMWSAQKMKQEAKTEAARPPHKLMIVVEGKGSCQTSFNASAKELALQIPTAIASTILAFEEAAKAPGAGEMLLHWSQEIYTGKSDAVKIVGSEEVKR